MTKKFQIGEVTADTKKELGLSAVEHIGLGLAPDELVGKQVRFKEVNRQARHGVFTVIGCQKVWGYDEDGKYTIIEGYRVAKNENDFGIPCSRADFELV